MKAKNKKDNKHIERSFSPKEEKKVNRNMSY